MSKPTERIQRDPPWKQYGTIHLAHQYTIYWFSVNKEWLLAKSDENQKNFDIIKDQALIDFYYRAIVQVCEWNDLK